MHYLEIGHGCNGGRLRPFRDQWRFREKLEQLHPDIVHINPSLKYRSFFRDALCIREAKRRGCRVLVFFRGWSPSFARLVDGPLHRVFANSYGKADGFIVLAKEFERRLRTWGITAPIFHGVTMVAEETVDEELVQQRLAETECLPESGPVRILYMSRLERKKGVLESVKAVELLRRSGRHVSLTVAGKGVGEADLKAYLNAHPEVCEYVTLVGNVSGQQKADILTSHHLFCFPTSYGEGMPTAVVEAMAFGLPVVTTPVGGIVDFFVSGKMGMLVRTKDVGVLAETLDQFVSNRTRMVEVGRYNFAYARDHFYSATVAEQMLDIYHRVVTLPP